MTNSTHTPSVRPKCRTTKFSTDANSINCGLETVLKMENTLLINEGLLLRNFVELGCTSNKKYKPA
jgi:hypothetical protein